MSRSVRNLALFLAGAGYVAALALALLRPGGVPAAMDAWRKMKAMESEVRNLREDVLKREQRVEQLEKSDIQRKGAVRKYLNKAQPGETIIILPETPAPADAPR
jgi:hypothetical protein